MEAKNLRYYSPLIIHLDNLSTLLIVHDNLSRQVDQRMLAASFHNVPLLLTVLCR